MTDWTTLDTWIVVTGALAAMACALPGNFLVVRRQSMMGDALAHAVLPGIVAAFLLTQWLQRRQWIGDEALETYWHLAMLAGALAVGVLCALLTEWIQRLGQVESSAALGVVFTSLFALGLLLIRLVADNVHLDQECVLYGALEIVALDTVGRWQIPRAALVTGGMLVVNLLLVALLFKELRISAFDPAVARTLGIPARRLHYGLMAVTAATLVAAFETVGSILVIAMLIVPPATAYLLTDRLSVMIGFSLALAAASALLGHLSAITLPALIFGWLGFAGVTDASTAGMMATASGLLFVVVLLAAPRYGLVSRAARQLALGLKIAGEDVLGLAYRLEESQGAAAVVPAPSSLPAALSVSPLVARLAVYRLLAGGQLTRDADGYRLTDSGRQTAEHLVRAHRLWESYMAEHFDLPQDHLHATAARVEHFIEPQLREQLAEELQAPEQDPHGRHIPPGRRAPAGGSRAGKAPPEA